MLELKRFSEGDDGARHGGNCPSLCLMGLISSGRDEHLATDGPSDRLRELKTVGAILYLIVYIMVLC